MKRSKYFFLTALLLLFAMAVSAQEADISIKQSTLDFLNNSGFAMIGQNWKVILMIAISCLLFFLAIVKQYEPLLLLPIAFGMLLTNLPGANMYHPELWSAFLDANSPAYHSYGAIMANGGLLDILYIGNPRHLAGIVFISNSHARNLLIYSSLFCTLQFCLSCNLSTPLSE